MRRERGAATIAVEVAYATPEEQLLVELELDVGATADEAIEAAFARLDRPRPDPAMTVGIWGDVVPPETVLKDGARVEIYRPLQLDPREARRRYAAAGGTMATGTGSKERD